MSANLEVYSSPIPVISDNLAAVAAVPDQSVNVFSKNWSKDKAIALGTLIFLDSLSIIAFLYSEYLAPAKAG